MKLKIVFLILAGATVVVSIINLVYMFLYWKASPIPKPVWNFLIIALFIAFLLIKRAQNKAQKS